MKKLLLLLILISNITFALPITLKEYMAKNSAWSSSDKALLSYITNRFGVMSEYYKTLDEGIKNISDHGVFSHGDIKIDVSTCMDYLNSNILK